MTLCASDSAPNTSRGSARSIPLEPMAGCCSHSIAYSWSHIVAEHAFFNSRLSTSFGTFGTWNLEHGMDEKEQGRQRLKIFLTFWGLLAALAGLNLYIYLTLQIRMSLVVMLICGIVFIAWGVFYAFYVRRSK